jgi:hypothetical protein
VIPRIAPVALSLLLFGAGRGTVDGLADSIALSAKGALDPLRDRDVLVVVEGTPVRLARDLGELVVGRLRKQGARSAARAESAPDAARARGAGWDGVVRIALEQAAGRLRVSGSVTTLGGGLWGEPGAVLAHLHQELPLDDELRGYGVSVPAEAPVRAPLKARQVAIGDLPLIALDAGPTQLVGATATEAVALRLDGARAVEMWRLPIVSKPASLRPRTEVATVVLDGAIIARSALASEGVVRGRPGGVRGFRFPGLPWICELAPGMDQFAAESCSAPQGALPERFWAAAGLRRPAGSPIVSELGPSPPVVAAIQPAAGGAGALWLKSGDAAPITVRNVGAQVALASLDRGDVVVVSEPALAGEPDAIVVRALAPEAPVMQRFDKLPGVVKALAAGDIDGDGHDEIVAVVRDDAARRTELWIIE